MQANRRLPQLAASLPKAMTKPPLPAPTTIFREDPETLAEVRIGEIWKSASKRSKGLTWLNHCSCPEPLMASSDSVYRFGAGRLEPFGNAGVPGQGEALLVPQ